MIKIAIAVLAALLLLVSCGKMTGETRAIAGAKNVYMGNVYLARYESAGMKYEVITISTGVSNPATLQVINLTKDSLEVELLKKLPYRDAFKAPSMFEIITPDQYAHTK